MEDKIIRSPFPDVNVPKNVDLTEFLFSKMKQYGSKTALICSKSGRRLTFDQIIKNTKQIAELLKRCGIQKHEVVGICMQSGIEYLPLVLAVISIEAVCATSNPSYTIDELNHNFSLSKVSYVIIDEENDDKVSIVSKKYPGIKKVFIPQWNNDVLTLTQSTKFRAINLNTAVNKLTNPNVRFLFSSSGTTGPPKAVMLTEENLKTFLCAYSPNTSFDGTMKMFSFTETDIVLSVFPHFHVGGLCMTLMTSLKDGATCVVLPKYQTKSFVHCIETYKPTVLIAPPPVYVFLAKSPTVQDVKIPSLKNAYIAGSPAGKELIEAVCKKFHLNYMIEAYGLSELSSISYMMPICDKSKTKLGSCGVLIPNGLCKVIDIGNGRLLGPNEHGEICYKSNQVMPGYLNNDKATKESLDIDNWLHTGDIGYCDEDGFFYIVDRIKELIKVKGYQVAPAELEDVLMSHPAVTDAAVVGIIDEYAGELPRAYIVKNPNYNLTEDEIKKHVSDKVIAYKRLEGGVEFVDEIPKGPSGKILRRLLRDKARSEMKIVSKL